MAFSSGFGVFTMSGEGSEVFIGQTPGREMGSGPHRQSSPLEWEGTATSSHGHQLPATRNIFLFSESLSDHPQNPTVSPTVG